MINVIEKIAPAEDYKPAVGSTQEHLLIKTIHDDIVILKDGTLAAVISTSAVNFDLLSENEQLAIIASFAGMLNSLSFTIQIVIRSKRLDVTDYLKNLTKIEHEQKNPLLKKLMTQYRTFVETLTSENEVLDKQFYVVIPVSYLEIGVINNLEKDLPKALNVLKPRVDHIMKQLSRIGLKSEQLSTERLIKLYYDIFNESYEEQDIRAFVDKAVSQKTTTEPEVSTPKKEDKHIDEIIEAATEKTTEPTEQSKNEEVAESSTPQKEEVSSPRPEKAPETETTYAPKQQTQAGFHQTDINSFELGPISSSHEHFKKQQEDNPAFDSLFTGSKSVHLVHEKLDERPSSSHPSRPQTPFIVEELSDDYGSAS